MLAAPELALRVLGFSETGPATVAVGRIAGGRDCVLGVLTLTALGDRERLRRASLANAGADAGDVAAFAIALGTKERTAAVRGIGAAVPAALVGLWVAWRLS